MTIYIDIVLIENICMNYIILFASNYILKEKVRHVRLLLSAFLGAIYAIITYMQLLKVYSNIIMKIILSIVMVYIAYKPKKIKKLFKQLILFYLISFVFGGCSFALLYFVKPQEIIMKNGMYVGTYPLKIAILGAIVGFVIAVIAFKIVKTRLRKNDMFCKIKIFLEEKSVEIIAMLDTGNLLKDPISRMPVVIVEKEIIEKIFPSNILENLQNIIGGDAKEELYGEETLKYLSKFRVIPFNSLGKQNGMLLGFKPSKLIVYLNDNEEIIKNVIIGIYDEKLSKKSTYNALIGLDITERSDENGYIEKINK